MGFSAEKFWDRVANDERKYLSNAGQGISKTVQLTIERLTTESEVLDFACGSGLKSITIAEHVKHIDGIDSSEKMISVAKERLAKSDLPNVNFATWDILNAAIHKKYDAVLAFNIFHLLEDPKTAIEKLALLLKPGGRLISATACMGEGFSLIALLLGVLGRLWIVPRFNRLSVCDLTTSKQAAGLRISEAMELDGKFSEYFIVAEKSK